VASSNSWKNTTTGPISVRTKYDIGNPYDMEGFSRKPMSKIKSGESHFGGIYKWVYPMGFLHGFVLQRSQTLPVLRWQHGSKSFVKSLPDLRATGQNCWW